MVVGIYCGRYIMVTGRSLDVLTSLLINFVNCKNLGVDKDKALRGVLCYTLPQTTTRLHMIDMEYIKL